MSTTVSVRGICGYTRTMNKKVILFFATVGGLVGGYVPFLFGDQNIFDAWSILGGLVGGLMGIWLGVVVSKRMS